MFWFHMVIYGIVSSKLFRLLNSAHGSYEKDS